MAEASAWRIRAAAAADADALSLIASATFLDTYAGSLDGADVVSHCIANNTAERFAGWTAIRDDAVTIAEIVPGHAPIGYSVLTGAVDLPVAPEPGDIELRRVYALSRLHGTGLGRALIERAFDDARRLGKRRLLLGVWGENFRAHRFYEKHGFVRAGTRQFRVGSVVHDDLVYARSL